MRLFFIVFIVGFLSLLSVKAVTIQRQIKQPAATQEEFLDTTFEAEAEKEGWESMRQNMLLPDVEPLPARDIKLSERNGRLLLFFSATYWNRGEGPFELQREAQKTTANGDEKTDVFQRVFLREDNSYDHFIGTFLWHKAHNHHHFEDFSLYSLAPVNDKQKTISRKVSFCVRDMDPINLTIENASERAVYTSCGRTKQGVSVGWGDTYANTLPDQYIDVTDMPSGEYYLGITIDPEMRFAEKTRSNNATSTRIRLDTSQHVVKEITE